MAPVSQNEMIECCAQEVTSVIVSEMIQSKMYAIMADEARDGQSEQLAVCVRYVSEGEVCEHILALTELMSFDAKSITDKLEEQLQKNGIADVKCVAQTYDGAAVMSRTTGGVQARFRGLHPEAIYIHCYAHELNLVLCHTCRAVSEAVELFDLLESLYSFFHHLPGESPCIQTCSGQARFGNGTCPTFQHSLGMSSSIHKCSASDLTCHT